MGNDKAIGNTEIALKIGFKAIQADTLV